MICALFQTPSNNEQISGMNEKADGAIAEVNGHCEDQVAAEGGY